MNNQEIRLMMAEVVAIQGLLLAQVILLSVLVWRLW